MSTVEDNMLLELVKIRKLLQYLVKIQLRAEFGSEYTTAKLTAVSK